MSDEQMFKAIKQYEQIGEVTRCADCKQTEYCIGCVFQEEDKIGCMLSDTPNNWNFDSKSESEGEEA